ncbi:iron ABC transporter permease [Rhodococcus artemisiae]|uniref:Iron ABC transporter permease n=1 Tax=Rhodococcus artemisiae TaxID=714159 RepID=A0ABU7LGQ3_9NOCA|nr:iron ABC transporter permease [Rhodococcus artemisiae]MEE2060740.1 iron ABC transporter permease [Rhodococcus artemisiae]
MTPSTQVDTDVACGADSARDAGAGTPAARRHTASGITVLVTLLAAVVVVGLWHLTQGTSGVGTWDLVRLALGAQESVGGVSVGDIFSDSRLPRLCAGAAVGITLGVAGALLQSVTRNPLASPDTLAVTAGAYFALTLAAAIGLTLPIWVSSGVAFVGGLLAAAVVLTISGRATGTTTARLILAGSAIAMALDAATGALLILFKENTTGLYAWGSGSLAQLNIDATARMAPLIATVLLGAMLLARRLDVLKLGDDAASSLGVPVRSTRFVAVACAVVLTSISVSLAGPIAFVGLGAPVLVRLLARRVPSLHRHVFLIPAAGLLGALLILLADVLIRAILGPQGSASIPTGVPTAVLGGVLIVILAMRMRDSGSGRALSNAGSRLRSHRRFVVVAVASAAVLIAVVVLGLLAGSLWLRLGDIGLWLQGGAPPLVSRALNERAPRIAAAALAGAALALAGCLVQGTVRNPLAEPGILGITAGAGLGAATVVTLLGGGRPLMIGMAIVAGILTFALVAAVSWRGGFLPERFVLVGIGFGYCITATTTFLLLSVDPWKTPRIFTSLSGTTYGRVLEDVVPVAVVLLAAIPVSFVIRRQLDLLAVDEDTPRILGVRTARTRLVALGTAALLAAVSVVAVGVVGFVGLIAPHLARAIVGAQHRRIIPVSMLLGAGLLCVADILGRTLIAPSQIPAGLMIALIGAPYFVWLLRHSRV